MNKQFLWRKQSCSRHLLGREVPIDLYLPTGLTRGSKAEGPFISFPKTVAVMRPCIHTIRGTPVASPSAPPFTTAMTSRLLLARSYPLSVVTAWRYKALCLLTRASRRDRTACLVNRIANPVPLAHAVLLYLPILCRLSAFPPSLWIPTGPRQHHPPAT